LSKRALFNFISFILIIGSLFLHRSRQTNRNDKTLDDSDFRLKHYAGDVVYNAEAFIDKNKDLLFRDLIYAIGSSSNPNIKCVLL